MKYKLNKDEFLKDLKGLMQIKTVSGDAGAITEAAPLGEDINNAIEYMLKLGKKQGFKTKNCDGYCGYIEMGQGKEIIAILTHLDTVSVGDDWSVDPFDLTIKDNKLMGRGVLDDKGPTMAAFYAMTTLDEMEYPLNHRIRLIIGGDEESGRWECMNRYKKTEEIPLYAFSPDSGFPVIFAEKGIINVSFKKELDKNEIPLVMEGGKQVNAVPDYARAYISGQCYELKGKAAHALEPEKGVNAILKLAKLLKDQEIKHPMVELLSIMNKKSLDIDLADDISGELTLNPAIINVNNGIAELICDIRYPITLDADLIIENIKKATDQLGFKVVMTHHVKPLYVDKESFLVKSLQKVYYSYTGDDSEPIATGGGTYARAFKNAVAFGGLFPGEENMCHQKDEAWSMDSLEKNYEIIIEALKALA